MLWYCCPTMNKPQIVYYEIWLSYRLAVNFTDYTLLKQKHLVRRLAIYCTLTMFFIAQRNIYMLYVRVYHSPYPDCQNGYEPSARMQCQELTNRTEWQEHTNSTIANVDTSTTPWVYSQLNSTSFGRENCVCNVEGVNAIINTI